MKFKDNYNVCLADVCLTMEDIIKQLVKGYTLRYSGWFVWDKPENPASDNGTFIQTKHNGKHQSVIEIMLITCY